MGEYRRRRLEPEDPKNGGGGIPILPLIVLVVFAGLLLGAVLARFLGRGTPTAQASSAPTFTPLPSSAASVMPFPTTTPSPERSSKPSPTPSLRPSPTASPTPAIRISPSPPAKPTGTPTAAASATPSPAPTATPKPERATPKPTERPTSRPTEPPTPSPTPSPALIAGSATASHAAAIVRSYLTAMSQGQSSFAAGYLKSGLPTEEFIRGGRVTDVSASQNADGTFSAVAIIVAPGGNYTETFRLVNSPVGLQITDHVPVAH